MRRKRLLAQLEAEYEQAKKLAEKASERRWAAWEEHVRPLHEEYVKAASVASEKYLRLLNSRKKPRNWKRRTGQLMKRKGRRS